MKKEIDQYKSIQKNWTIIRTKDTHNMQFKQQQLDYKAEFRVRMEQQKTEKAKK